MVYLHFAFQELLKSTKNTSLIPILKVNEAKLIPYETMVFLDIFGTFLINT